MISEEDTDKHLAEVLEVLKEIFEGGGKWALLYAIHECLLLKRPLPEWLRLAFLAAYDSARGYEIKSWNETFGRPHPKGTHLKKEKLRRVVIHRVWTLKAEDPERPIDRGLFDQIGEELEIPGGTIDGLYYDERSRELRELLERTYNLFVIPDKK
jgi:hypothetical protein